MARNLYAVPAPRRIIGPALNQASPLANIVNLQSSVGAFAGTDPTDYIGELGNRIKSDIATSRANANVDVNGMLARIKAQQSGWKPPVQSLPASQYTITGRAPTGGGPVAGVKLSGNVDQWIAQAYKILGIPLTPTALAHERYLVKHESGGNPRAVNRWDSNAKKGTPSMGVEQTIMPTFLRWKLPGHNDIFNPVDNMIASLRYRKGTKGTYDIGYYPGGY